MTAPARTMSAAEFHEWMQQPAQRDTDYELIAGEVVAVVSHPTASRLGARLLIRVGGFVEEHNLGEVSGADGGYIIGEGRYIPDVGFIATANLPPTVSVDGYVPAPPDLAVEVVSPTDSRRLLMIKVGDYLAAGTLVWVVYPAEQQVDVYAPGQPVRSLSKTATLDGGTVLPGFSLALQSIFR